MNHADSIAADLARLLIAQSQPPKRAKNRTPLLTYDPGARARKKRQREARKRNRPK